MKLLRRQQCHARRLLGEPVQIAAELDEIAECAVAVNENRFPTEVLSGPRCVAAQAQCNIAVRKPEFEIGKSARPITQQETECPAPFARVVKARL